MMALLVVLHVLAAVVWVGGMVFAYMFLRPVAGAQLEPPARLTLWAGVFGRFFPWVWGSVALLLGTGFYMIFGPLGGMGGVGPHVHTMMVVGILMMAIFLHIYFSPYGRLKRAVAAQDWPAGGKALAQIRTFVGINTVLGLVTVAVASGGGYLLI